MIRKILRLFAHSAPYTVHGKYWGFKPNWAEKLLRWMDRR